MKIDEARQLLSLAGLFFDNYPKFAQTINLNDSFYWNCSDSEDVSDEELPELARLFCAYGRSGVYYWVLEKRGETSVEFLDVNRGVEFVRREEGLRAQVPASSKRAYHKIVYTLGEG